MTSQTAAKLTSRSFYWDNCKGFLNILVVFAHFLYGLQLEREWNPFGAKEGFRRLVQGDRSRYPVPAGGACRRRTGRRPASSGRLLHVLEFVQAQEGLQRCRHLYPNRT